ncbi:acyltransferase family protein [Mesorhizobium sp. AR02]|uniref:acyltransferase family protein n=1 Tax=Mesorhizobium sp. AR02 TaxID=2865837 RepID=UPI00215F3753|nr:acyltransferase [Mesorhizobium sp. AR02]
MMRFLFALGVIAQHLNWPFNPNSGLISVFGFYTVSGYLITRVLDTTYRANILPFLVNRALRIYPAYLVAMLFGLGIGLIMGGTPLNPAIAIPDSFDAWIRQVGIFGLLPLAGVGGYPIRLVPPAWSLNMELTWYLMMIPLSRRVGLWLAASICIAAALINRGDSGHVYYAYYGPSLCFALGAAVYRFRLKLSKAHIIPAFSALLLLVVAADIYGASAWLLYASSAATAYALSCADFRSSRFAKADQRMGDLAYPMFLCHWHVAALFGSQPGWPLLLTSLPAIIGVSALMVVAIERPMETIRKLVRPRGSAGRWPPVSGAPNSEAQATQAPL